MSEYITILPKAGLCNRLRFLFSFKYKMIQENINKKLVVIWPVNIQCNGFLWDVIKPLDNCWALKNNNRNFKISASSCGPISLYKNCNYLKNIEFKPRDRIYDRIIQLINLMSNKYIALHIRRTDLTGHLKYKKMQHLETKDQSFIDFIKKNKQYKVYIATDNKETQIKFKKLFPKRVIFNKEIIKINGHRRTSLEDAIIDIFMCALSNKFQGTFYSSFSEFIQLMRRDNNILDNNHENPKELCIKKYK